MHPLIATPRSVAGGHVAVEALISVTVLMLLFGAAATG